MSGSRFCVACAQPFVARPQAPGQSYCSAAPCQRERRRIWQRARRQEDPDYRENQARAQEAWRQRNPDYWRQYRADHPDYADRNRQQQRARRQPMEAATLAKKNVWNVMPPLDGALAPGLYRLTLVVRGDVAKMGASFVVELAPLRREDR